jgi:hypothetical protein
MCPTVSSTFSLVHFQALKKHVVLLLEVDWQYADSLVPELHFITSVVALVVVDLGTDNDAGIVVIGLTHDLT